MNKTFKNILLLAALFSIPQFTKAQLTQEAIVYMKDIQQSMEKTKNDTWQYLKAVTKGKGARKVESKRQNLLVEMKEVRSEIKKKGSFNSDDTLRKAVLNYIDMSYIVLKEDFDKILDMEDIAEQSYDLMEAYILAKEKAGDKLDSAFDLVLNTQNKYAERYGITLNKAEEDSKSLKIKKATESLKYYNQVYLIFFKSFKQEFYIFDAIQRNDLIALEQNINFLSTTAQEGLDQLKNINGFHGDIVLKVAAQKMLTFYKQEAEKDLPIITDFYIKKDNFEKISESFESISEKNRTQKDIDEFNNAVNDFNQSIGTMNKVSEATDKKRNESLTYWNNMVEVFFDKHSN